VNEQHQRVLSWLKANSTNIAEEADSQKIAFVEETWRKWLQEAGWPEPLINRVFGIAVGGAVSRAEIRSQAKSATSPDDLRILFAVAMIWGRGKSNGRMKQGLIACLGNSGLDRALENSARELQAAGPAAAYRSWVSSGLTGIREPFFTKWLWAAGCSQPAGNQALVLDSRVWASLGALDWSSIEAAGTRKRAERYGAYVKSCEQWSDGILGVSAEDVEWALFDWNGGNNEKSALKSP
jgi:hypothetical protein